MTTRGPASAFLIAIGLHNRDLLRATEVSRFFFPFKDDATVNVRNTCEPVSLCLGQIPSK